MDFNELFVEKFRPKTLKDLLLTKDVREFFEHLEKLEDKTVPHLLFIGPAGTGKCLDGDEYIEIYVEEDFYKKLQNLNMI